jgi:DNA polymerase III gamma/tau subunit
VQHTGEVPGSLPVTEETRDRLREQAHQLAPATVLRLVDLLRVAVDDMRQGADPRLPLELALVKVTRPAADLSRESLAFRLERLERGAPPSSTPSPASDKSSQAEDRPEDDELPEPEPAPEPPSLELAQLQEAWRRSVLPAVQERSIPTAVLLQEAHPAALEDGVLTLEFPASASFLRRQAEEPGNVALVQEALYAVTSRRLGLAFAVGPERERPEDEQERPASEEEIVELMKSTFEAREVDR